MYKLFFDKWYDMLWSKYTIWTEKHKKPKSYLDAYCLKGGTEDPDKWYYVFRWKSSEYSIFSVELKMLLACEWAERNHFIPVVAFEYEDVFVEGNLSASNMWDLCFEQTCKIENIEKKKNVLVGPVIRGKEDYKYLRETLSIINNDKNDPYIHAESDVYGYREYYKKLNVFGRKSCIVQSAILAEVDALEKKLFSEKRVLGLSLRERFNVEEGDGENAWKIFSKHPTSLPIEEICELIHKYMKKWNFSYIFVGTFFEDSIEKLKEEFGDKLIYLDRSRRRLDKEFLDENDKFWELLCSGKVYELNKYSKSIWSKEESQERLISYLKEVLLLSRCDYFIGAKSSGTIMACIMNGGKYEDMYIIPDGRGSKKY